VIDLEAIFGEVPAAAATAAPIVLDAPAPGPSGIIAMPGDMMVVIPSGIDMDGVLLDDLTPCPRCNSLELWETLAGTWRCQHCDAAALERSRSLAEKAARLRAQSLALRRSPTAVTVRCSGPVAAAGRPGAFTGP
jgi:hypothetical protein